MSRINLTSTVLDIVVDMSDGNPGAATVMALLTKLYHRIDPQSALRELTGLLWLDDNEVYGSDIWLLYKDVCDQHLTKMITLMRAVQLGIVPISAVKSAMQNRYTRAGSNSFNFEHLHMFVREKIGVFDPEDTLNKDVLSANLG